MSHPQDQYEVGISAIIEKITKLQNKIQLIKFPTMFRQSANNNSMLLLELVKIFGKRGSSDPHQMVHRFMQIERALFVDTVSAFEYEIRRYIQEETDSKFEDIQEKLQKNPIMSISKLLCFLKEIGYVNDMFYKKLDGIFAIRNMIVHHHSVVNIMENHVPNELQKIFAHFTIGKRMNGKPEIFLMVIEHIIDFYLIWYEDKPILEAIFNEDTKANFENSS